MLARLSATIAATSILFLAAGFTSARAADPAFCQTYAQAAVNQVRGGLSQRSCAGGLRGARWSEDFRVHYSWCLGASIEAAGAERDARTNFLKACRPG